MNFFFSLKRKREAEVDKTVCLIILLKKKTKQNKKHLVDILPSHKIAYKFWCGSR